MNAEAKRSASGAELVLGRYRIVRPLGRGGMGVVYLARAEGAAGFARPVVIKRILQDFAMDRAAAQAFAREARILANLDHPGIVKVLDFDEESGAYVMVLEYVHGFHLGQWCRYVVETRQRVPFEYVISIMGRVLDALHYAHTFKRSDGTVVEIVHRDVTPGNILLDAQGTVKLVDFGIARMNDTGEYKTRDGGFKGTLTYSAPETYDGGRATPASDVYSAAVVVYHLLAGDNPFRGKDVRETVRRVLQDDPVPITALRDDVPEELDEVLNTALSKDPAERYESAQAFARALRGLRTRPEEDTAAELTQTLFADFNGGLPDRLGLEPLRLRDQAWRDVGGQASGRLSSTPPSRPRTDDERTVIEPNAVPTVVQPKLPSSAVPKKRSRAAWLVSGAVLVLGAGAGVVAFSRSGSTTTPEFVVVEKQQVSSTPSGDPAAPPDPAGDTPKTASSAASLPAESGSAGAVAPPKAATDAKSSPKSLSRIFGNQRGRIESCFQNNVRDVDGRPEVSVHFRVDRAGNVEQADLGPASLSATPLGQCLLGVAKSTHFGPQPEPVSFTIPITARRVQ